MDEPKLQIAIGSDHAGYRLKEAVRAYLSEKGCEIIDVGTDSEESVDYPDIGIKVSRLISEGKIRRGILMCGTGIGMSMVANRFPHVRAALCNDIHAARMSRHHNDSNILVMGGRIIDKELAFEIIDAWLGTPFDGGRHQGRLDKFDRLPDIDEHRD